MATKMGFEGQIFYGAAGSTATNQLLNARDITETFDTEEGSTKRRGDGSTPPMNSFRVVGRTYSLEWQMIHKTDDSYLTAMIAAAVAGTPVAIRTKSYSSGLGYDGDMNLKFKRGKPLNGEQTFDFTATVNEESRSASLNI